MGHKGTHLESIHSGRSQGYLATAFLPYCATVLDEVGPTQSQCINGSLNSSQPISVEEVGINIDVGVSENSVPLHPMANDH